LAAPAPAARAAAAPLILRLAVLALLAGLFVATPAMAHDGNDHDHDEPKTSSQWTRKGPLKHLDARQRKKFHEEIGFSYPFLILGGLDLASAIVVTASTPYLWQGIVGMVSGGGLIISGLGVMVHTLVDWGLGPARKDYWEMRGARPGTHPLQIAVLPGAIVGRW
jgi:hypothetical protein